MIYLATIEGNGYQRFVFATHDKGKAETWASRFNKIIDDNADRVGNWRSSTHRDPLWYDYIVWDEVEAVVREIPIR